MKSGREERTYEHWLWLVTAFAVTHLLFAAVPGIDIWMSSLFYWQEHGFRLNDNHALQTLRDVILYSSILLCLLALVLWPASAFHRAYAGVPPRVWCFIVALYVSGPLLLVNGIFKNFSGRARPAHIQEFGGTKEFSRAFELADQCEKNCSFISGEGSAAVVFCISVMVLVRYLPINRYHGMVRALAVTVAALGLFLREVKGRHFLSDSVFAILIMTGLACLLHQILFSKSLFRSDNRQAPTAASGAPAGNCR